MTALKASGLVPKLRFPEFQGHLDWEPRELGDGCNVVNGGTPKSAIPEYWDGNVPWLTPKDMGQMDGREIGSTPRTISQAGLAASSAELVPERSVILSTRAPIGHLAINTMPIAFNQGCRGLIPRDDIYYLFLFYSLLVNRDQLQQFGAGATFKELSVSSLKKIKIPLPNLEEQQCIADCLSSLDDLIAVADQKLEALRQHKQGLMQQLFPQPGETVPRLRFPEFSDTPEWDLLPLSYASDVNPSNDGLPESFIYIDLESVKSGMLIERKEITRDAAPSRAQRLLSRNDIVYQTVRPYQRNNFFFEISDEHKYVASTGYALLRAHECPKFLYQLLHTDSFVNSVLDRCTGSNYPAINPSALASIPIPIPPTVTEQQKIADCLGSLDDLITAEDRKLEALRQHKQGLMQQLFPSLDGQ